MPRQVTLERVFLHPVVIGPPPPLERVRTWLTGVVATLRYGWGPETPDAASPDVDVVLPANRAPRSS